MRFALLFALCLAGCQASSDRPARAVAGYSELTFDGYFVRPGETSKYYFFKGTRIYAFADVAPADTKYMDLEEMNSTSRGLRPAPAEPPTPPAPSISIRPEPLPLLQWNTPRAEFSVPLEQPLPKPPQQWWEYEAWKHGWRPPAET